MYNDDDFGIRKNSQSFEDDFVIEALSSIILPA